MIDTAFIAFMGMLGCICLGAGVIALGRSAMVGFDYDGKSLKGGYICEVCGKPIIGRDTHHTREECKAARTRPFEPNHTTRFGAEKFTRMPSYDVAKEAEGQ